MTDWLVFFLGLGFSTLCIALALDLARRGPDRRLAAALVAMGSPPRLVALSGLDPALLVTLPATLPTARVVRGGR